MQNFRKIKTQSKIIGTKYDIRAIPQLLLKGLWLQEAGFEPGVSCSVKVEMGRITILNL